MSNKEILERAIQKAIDGGWKHEPLLNATKWIFGANVYHTGFDFIYDHNFARGLWGEARFTKQKNKRWGMLPWRYHLQQMVIADDPIQYLGENIA